MTHRDWAASVWALVGLCLAAWVGAVACATAGRPAFNDPGMAASEAHKASVAACRAYHTAVELGAPARPEADAACVAAEGVCKDP